VESEDSVVDAANETDVKAEDTGQQTTTCYACGAEVPAGEKRCPVCRRRQLRQCYCGAWIPVTASRCPECGADWSQSVRVKRKSRSQQIHPRVAARYAAVGALAALLVVGLIQVLVTVLAAVALSPGEAMPEGLVARMGLALATVGACLSRTVGLIASHMATLGLGLLVMALGAAVGAVYYLNRIGALPWSAPKKRTQRKRRG